MEKIRNIVVFENDKYFLFMLKGYCYANNVRMTEIPFTLEGIYEAQTLNPALIFIPLDWISPGTNKGIETGLLKLACGSKAIKIYALNKSSGVLLDAPAWIDGVITNPMDIVEIDRLIKTAWSGDYLVDRRINKDRRILADRRQNHYNHNAEGHHGMDSRKPEGAPHEEGKLDALGFHVDVRQKCLFIKGHKIDLTPKEFELIEYLSTDPDRIFTPDEIVKHLWPENHRATKSDLYQYIHLLRKKIEKDHNQPQLILNAKGFGYKLNVLSRQEPAASFAASGQNRGKVTQMEQLKSTPALSS